MISIELAQILVTFALLIAVGIPVRAAGRRLQVPPAVSLIALGILLGTSGLDALPAAYRDVGSYLSKAAFVVLLLRAGLGIPPSVLRRIMIFAIAFGIVPVAAELCVIVGGSRWLFFSDWRLALLAGFLVAAVSPAVILPTMLDQKDKGRGMARLVPDKIIIQTVVNAIIAQSGILLMLQVLDPHSDQSVTTTLLLFPVSLIGGVLFGTVAGTLLRIEYLVGPPDLSPRPVRVWGATLCALLASFAVYFGTSGIGLESVVATLAVGITLRHRLGWCEPDLRRTLSSVWGVAEIVLFVNLGSVIDVSQLTNLWLIMGLLGLMGTALIARVAVTRFIALRTQLTWGEKVYLTAAHLPKATIQAVFGAVIYLQLSTSGEPYAVHAQTFLIMSVLAIVATVPIGAVLMEQWGARLLGSADDDPQATPTRD